MARFARRGAALALALLLLLPCALRARAADTALERTAAYVQAAVPEPGVGAVGGEWAVLGLARGGLLPQDYGRSYYDSLCRLLRENKGTLSATKYTEYARVVLALTALGADPSGVAGYDLLPRLADCARVARQGVNGAVWALIALNALPGGAAYDWGTAGPVSAEDRYLAEVLDAQLPGGGWSLAGREPADPDLTAMALCALSPWKNGAKEADAAVARGLACLGGLQNADGTFGAPANAESCAQAVLALCELGIPMTDSRFVKEGNTAEDGLLSFARRDGSFAHTPGGGGDQMATEQALCALAALARSEESEIGASGFYDISGSEATASGPSGGPRLHPPRREMRDAAFPDLRGRPERDAVEALARLGILNGRADGRFDPDAPLTRAEFCVMLTRTLGLEAPASMPFTDVPAWCADAVAAAWDAGIVRGAGADVFRPDGVLTRQEGAVLAARADQFAAGTTVTYSQRAQERTLQAQGSDWADCGAWAGSGLTYCFQNGLLGGAIRPREALTRGEAAELLAGLLRTAQAHAAV